jgi:hypothetical protein
MRVTKALEKRPTPPVVSLCDGHAPGASALDKENNEAGAV